MENYISLSFSVFDLNSEICYMQQETCLTIFRSISILQLSLISSFSAWAMDQHQESDEYKSPDLSCFVIQCDFKTEKKKHPNFPEGFSFSFKSAIKP